MPLADEPELSSKNTPIMRGWSPVDPTTDPTHDTLVARIETTHSEYLFSSSVNMLLYRAYSRFNSFCQKRTRSGSCEGFCSTASWGWTATTRLFFERKILILFRIVYRTPFASKYERNFFMSFPFLSWLLAMPQVYTYYRQVSSTFWKNFFIFFLLQISCQKFFLVWYTVCYHTHHRYGVIMFTPPQRGPAGSIPHKSIRINTLHISLHIRGVFSFIPNGIGSLG